jgi:hypothetical protein
MLITTGKKKDRARNTLQKASFDRQSRTAKP